MSDNNFRLTVASRLDNFCLTLGSLTPVGIVIGNVVFELMIALTGFLWIIRCFAAKENPMRELVKIPFVIPWLVWFAIIMFSILVNGAGSKGLMHDIVFLRFIFFGLALLDISQRQPIVKRLICGLACGVILATVNTASAYICGHDLFGRPLTRYNGKIRESIRITNIAAYAAPFFICWGILDDKLSKVKKCVIIGLGLIALTQIFQSHMRTILIASSTAILSVSAYFSAFSKPKRLSLSFTVALLLAFALAMTLYFQIGKLWSLNTMHCRVYIWKVVWNMWINNPLFGVGISSFQDVFTQTSASGVVTPIVTVAICHSHNTLLHIASCSGIFGLVAFLWFFINIVRTVIKDLNGFRAAFLVFPIVMFIAGLTGFNIYYSYYQAVMTFFIVLIGASDKTFVKGNDNK